MGPPRERGGELFERQIAGGAVTLASMGPLRERGGDAAGDRIRSRSRNRLQWGHRANAVERGVSTTPSHSQNAVLQWGHRANAVESIWLESGLLFVSKLQWGHRANAVES